MSLGVWIRSLSSIILSAVAVFFILATNVKADHVSGHADQLIWPGRSFYTNLCGTGIAADRNPALVGGSCAHCNSSNGSCATSSSSPNDWISTYSCAGYTTNCERRDFGGSDTQGAGVTRQFFPHSSGTRANTTYQIDVFDPSLSLKSYMVWYSGPGPGQYGTGLDGTNYVNQLIWPGNNWYTNLCGTGIAADRNPALVGGSCAYCNSSNGSCTTIDPFNDKYMYTFRCSGYVTNCDAPGTAVSSFGPGQTTYFRQEHATANTTYQIDVFNRDCWNYDGNPSNWDCSATHLVSYMAWYAGTSGSSLPPAGCSTQGQSCGISSRDCCQPPTVPTPLTCVSDVCQPPPLAPTCGGLGQACCTTGSPCSTGLACSATNSCISFTITTLLPSSICTGTQRNVTFGWDSVSGANSYRVFSQQSGSTTWIALGSANVVGITATYAITPGTYTFQVRAYNASGAVIATSQNLTATIASCPTGPTVSTVDPKEIALTVPLPQGTFSGNVTDWARLTPLIRGLLINTVRSPSGSPAICYDSGSTLPLGVYSKSVPGWRINDTGDLCANPTFITGTTYYTAAGVTGLSGTNEEINSYGQWVSFRPMGLVASPLCIGSPPTTPAVGLSWNDPGIITDPPTVTVSGYQVGRRPASSTITPTPVTSATCSGASINRNQVTCTDDTSSLSPGNTYEYFVTAWNGATRVAYLANPSTATVLSCLPLTASCSVSPTSGPLSTSFTWTALAGGGISPYTYSWTGTGELNVRTGNPVVVTYSSATPATKTGSVTATDSVGSTTTSACINSAAISPSGPPWIQTTGGDVHSQTGIDLP